MKCPNCTTTLQLAERQGVEIDYCPRCRGVWLDRGELDKLIERAAAEWDAPPRYPSGPRWPAPRGDDADDARYPRRQRKSLLSELFDF
ncbi:MAG TPA: zf-TFIIB domain-containing protein [Chloroflexota bacterium]|jgi:Zn-finger nucleic acid-binding protein|nr:zf-TFIIB domain-containing protein [Chloroflexota bacterium]